MEFKKAVAVIGAVAALTLVAACGDDDSGSTSGSASASQSEDGGSTALPDGFPADIPVVKGEYKAYDAPADGAVGMEVVDPTATTFDEAVKMLKDAPGFTSVSDPDSGDDSLRTATFANDKYQVGVVGVKVESTYRVTYNVVPIK